MWAIVPQLSHRTLPSDLGSTHHHKTLPLPNTEPCKNTDCSKAIHKCSATQTLVPVAQFSRKRHQRESKSLANIPYMKPVRCTKNPGVNTLIVCRRSSLEYDQIFGIRLCVAEDHKDWRRSGIVDYRVISDSWATRFRWRDDAGLISNNELSGQDSRLVHVFVAIDIWNRICVAARILEALCEVHPSSVDDSCTTEQDITINSLVQQNILSYMYLVIYTAPIAA